MVFILIGFAVAILQNYFLNGYFSQIISKGKMRNGISINAILMFPDFIAKAIINTIDIAFSTFPKKMFLESTIEFQLQ